MSTDLTAIRQRAEAAKLVEDLRQFQQDWREDINQGRWQTNTAYPLLEAADRIEALERSLVTARAALEDANKWHGYAPLGREAPGIKAFAAMKERRQQALTEIDEALGAETAKVQP